MRSSEGFPASWQKLDIAYDDSIRHHGRAPLPGGAGALPQDSREGGHLLRGVQRLVLYPLRDFLRKPPSRRHRPDCGRPVELLQEESYFFRCPSTRIGCWSTLEANLISSS